MQAGASFSVNILDTLIDFVIDSLTALIFENTALYLPIRRQVAKTAIVVRLLLGVTGDVGPKDITRFNFHSVLRIWTSRERAYCAFSRSELGLFAHFSLPSFSLLSGDGR